MDFDVVQMLQDNLLQTLAFLTALIASIKSIQKHFTNYIVNMKDNAEKHDIDDFKQEIMGELEDMKRNVLETKEIQEALADFQANANEILPEKYKEKLREILQKYKQEEE